MAPEAASPTDEATRVAPRCFAPAITNRIAPLAASAAWPERVRCSNSLTRQDAQARRSETTGTRMSSPRDSRFRSNWAGLRAYDHVPHRLPGVLPVASGEVIGPPTVAGPRRISTDFPLRNGFSLPLLHPAATSHCLQPSTGADLALPRGTCQAILVATSRSARYPQGSGMAIGHGGYTRIRKLAHFACQSRKTGADAPA